MLLYLHGFESSPASPKITELKNFLASRAQASELLAEQLPASMAATRDYIDGVLSRCQPRAVMGSSLGGFWTHYAVSCLRARGQPARGVLINPAVQPAQWLADEMPLREHPYTGERYQLGNDDKQTLIAAAGQLDPGAELLVLLQTGDEQLDYRAARDYYRNQRMIVEQGGDHSFAGFARYLPSALEFLNVL
ncbi:YqiA/YcfP family alpha/beta fold hydrolase [Pseudidiomarina sp.]|uniref:YqiA/YcfP family alpha/beta fold hydrolase n=1 Tax=Pseudidiomarina sp. TaxID=2081707 RepID=UPI00299F2DD9|nr:YqiA/YcfP family alpha/beta fold hydrolase [Pseudidiomarina sp.]MDX1705987.1 YqiA/YcfP family alpha/beta fold hydrolase [Pseudidiomarina sp.]